MKTGFSNNAQVKIISFWFSASFTEASLTLTASKTLFMSQPLKIVVLFANVIKYISLLHMHKMLWSKTRGDSLYERVFSPPSNTSGDITLIFVLLFDRVSKFLSRDYIKVTPVADGNFITIIYFTDWTTVSFLRTTTKQCRKAFSVRISVAKCRKVISHPFFSRSYNNCFPFAFCANIDKVSLTIWYTKKSAPTGAVWK